MSELNELFSALSNAQAKFTGAKKDSDNPFFKSKYASLHSILEASKEALSENGLCIIQPIVYENGHTFIRTILGHSSGQSIQSDLPIPNINENSKNPLQDMGKAITYLRRYALQSLLLISSEDDDGNSAAINLRHKDVMDIYNSLSTHNKNIFMNGIKSLGCKTINDIPVSEIENSINWLKNLKSQEIEHANAS